MTHPSEEQDRFICKAELCEMLAMSPATVWRYAANDPDFPRPIQLSSRKTVYSLRATRQWMTLQQQKPAPAILRRRRRPQAQEATA